MTRHEAIGRKVLRCLHLNFREQAEKEIAEGSRRRARDVAKRLTRGSISIQKGAFATKDDLERERREARKYRFSS